MISHKKLLVISIVLLSSLLTFSAMGQDTNTSSNTLSLGLSEVSLIKGSTAPVSLILTPQSAGLAVKPSVSDSTARVLVSSVITGSNFRTMSVVFTGDLPGGTYLKLKAKDPNGNFVGGKGAVEPEVTYTTNGGAAQNIITGIGTCYSGTGSDDGYKLLYTFGVSASTENYGDIRAVGGQTVTATFTLTAAI
ncbi:MAG: hypothetical protein VB102_05860 [Paludibacter sp.]|nr:hypothetical protein [Paludibacter sp.]